MRASELSSSAIPRTVKWFVYLLSFTAAAYGYFLVLVSSYLPETGFGSGSVGLLLGASGSAMVLGAIPLGMYADRRGKKPVLVWGLLAFTPGLLLFALTTEILVLMVAAIVVGVTEGAFLSTWNAVIADMTTLENREKAFSLSFIASSLSLGAGLSIPFLFPWVEAITHQDSIAVHNAATTVMALLSLLSPVGLSRLLRDYRETIGPRVRMSREGLGNLWKFSGLNSLIGLGAGFMIPLMATWLLLRFAVTDTYSGPLLAVASLTIGLAAVASPALSRRYGTVNAIVLSQGMSAVFMLSLVATQSACSRVPCT